VTGSFRATKFGANGENESLKYWRNIAAFLMPSR